MNENSQYKSISALSCVALTIRPPLRFFSLELAKVLKEKFGSTVHAYCDSPLAAKFVEDNNADGRFASIQSERVLMDSAVETELDEKEVLATAKTYEERLGLTFNFLAVANRHLGRGYVLGGFYHPRSRYTENVGYIQMLHAYNKVLSFWENEIANKGLTVMVNNGREAASIAHLCDIPYRTMIGSKYENYHYWAWDAYLGSPMFKHMYENLPEDAGLTLETPYASHLTNRALFMKATGLLSTIRQTARLTLYHIYWHLTGHPKSRGYYWSDNIASLFRRWREFKIVNRIAHNKLSDLEGKRFVFYPLHLEPEAALHLISPEYFFQLSTIAALSRDLPAGYYLVVKETFSNIGRRPKNFYQQIADMKNVILLDTMEMGFDIVVKADVIATIGGTAGLEAALLGKPVITFGHHNNYNILPHVQLVTDQTKLKDILHRALEYPPLPDEAKRAAKRYLRAVVGCSFDMRDYHQGNLQKFSPEAIKDAVDALSESVRHHAAATDELERAI